MLSYSLSGPTFTIGGSSRCNLTLFDSVIEGSTVCKILHLVRSITG